MSPRKPDPDCRSCHGEGAYYEDVAGDGGSRMLVACDCWDNNPNEECGCGHYRDEHERHGEGRCEVSPVDYWPDYHDRCECTHYVPIKETH